MSKRLTPESESLLWDEFIAGKEDAFGKIYDLYVYPLFRFGSHISKDHGLVQDCIQDLFVDLFRYRSKLSKTENISVYLYVSLKRKIIKRVVKEFKNRSVTLENLPFEYLIRSSDDLENDESGKQVQALTKALEKLTDRQREAIYLRFVAGLDYDEMCGILKLNYQGARNLIHRGMEKLRETCKVSTIILFLAGNDKCVVQHV